MYTLSKYSINLYIKQAELECYKKPRQILADTTILGYIIQKQTFFHSPLYNITRPRLPAMILPESIEQIKDAARIEDVVGEFVTLTRKGINLIACCPFHAEKTPSFAVNPARGIFKCFGCGKGGDAIAFLREQGMDYVQAIRWLAKHYSIELKESDNGKPDPAHDRRVQMRTTASVVQAHFSMSPDEGDPPGRLYWLERGFNPETLDTFGIGYCDGSKPEHVPASDLSAIGATNEKGNLIFYKRATIPIHDRSGNIVSWAGRVVDEREGVAKYINGPETDIYSKSRTLYNLHRAAQHIRKAHEVWIVEGYADAMAAWQHGICNVVALCGTALTDAHVALLKKFNGDAPLRIVLALDNEITKTKGGDDEKTYKVQVAVAYFAAIEKLVTIGETVRMIYPKAKGKHLKDMADVVRAGLDPEAAEKVDVITDYVQRKVGEDDWKEKASPVQKADFQEHVARLIARVKRESVRDIYIKNLCDLLEVSPRKLSELVAKYDERTDEVAYDIMNYEYIAIKDEFRQRYPEKDEKTGEISWKYQPIKKSTITDQFTAAFIRTIPRFTKAVVEPSHLDYKRTIQIVTDMGTYNFFNDYAPLKFKPKPFNLPAGFIENPFEYDYTTIPEIQNIARLFKHIFDQGKNALGDSYLQIAWDWFAIMYLHPKFRLPGVGVVSKEEGTGKSTLMNVMARFFGDNSTKIDSSRIAAKFNSLMGGKVLAYCEETKDDRGAMENILKDLITGFDMVVEKKFGDAEVQPTYCKFLFASNHPETFMKIGTDSTRFFVSEVPKLTEKIANMEELCYLEIPYLAYFLEKRGIKTPFEDRLWFKPERYENETLIRLRDASKDIVQKNMEHLINEVFLKCQLTQPIFYITSSYLQDLMVSFAGRAYEQKTLNYFQNVAVRDLRVRYRDTATRKMVPSIRIKTNADAWDTTRESVQGRFLEFPIWRFCTPSDIHENYTADNRAALINALANEVSELEKTYGSEPANWLGALTKLSLTAEPAKVGEDTPF